MSARNKSHAPSSSEQLEFEEAEVWATIDDGTVVHKPLTKMPAASRQRPLRKPVRKSVKAGPSSLPVNIPDWSKILGRREHREKADEFEDDEETGDDGDRMPPHEYLARTRVASLSVHEGVGRTLKGRDLSRVRNAIWKQTGFED